METLERRKRKEEEEEEEEEEERSGEGGEIRPCQSAREKIGEV